MLLCGSIALSVSFCLRILGPAAPSVTLTPFSTGFRDPKPDFAFNPPRLARRLFFSPLSARLLGGEGDRELDIHDRRAYSAKDSTVRDRSNGLGGVSRSRSASISSLSPLSLSSLSPCRGPGESSRSRIRTSGVDLEVGSHERGRSIMDTRLLDLSCCVSSPAGWAEGRRVAEGLSVATSTVFGFGTSFSLFLSTPNRREAWKSSPRSKEGTSKAGRLGRLLRLSARD